MTTLNPNNSTRIAELKAAGLPIDTPELTREPATASTKYTESLPALSYWNCYHGNGKQHSYGIEQNGVKYSIEPITSQYGSGFIGYRLSLFDHSNPNAGHQSIDPAHGVVALHAAVLFSRPTSAAKAARESHAKRTN